jgi:hypothetical protein
MKDYRLHTVVFKGGSNFELRLPGNPLVRHRGGHTVAHLLLSEEEKSWINQSFAELHPKVEIILREQDGQDEEQKREREILLGIGQQDRVFLSATCPSCYWFDPMVSNACGFFGWDVGKRIAFAETELGKKAVQDCPLNPMKGGIDD